MTKSFYRKSATIFAFAFAMIFSGICFAEIERSVEPFTQAVTYSSKYSFTDSQRNMHSIALMKTIKPLKGTIGGKTHEVDTYFLLNFTLQQGATLGDSFDIQVTPRHINSLPLAPYMISGIGYSSVPTARTGHKELPPMTVVAIEKGEPLLVRVNFEPRGHAIYTIPEETVQEWAQLLKDPEQTVASTSEDNNKQEDTNDSADAKTAEDKSGSKH